MRHSPKQPWITRKALFFQPSGCWEFMYGPCDFFIQELANVKCFSWIENTLFFLRALMFQVQSPAFSCPLFFQAFDMRLVLSSLQEVSYECFDPFSLRRSEDPNSSLSGWLPDCGWCYFLHVTGEPCSVRHLPSNKGLRHLVSKCTEMSNELLTSNTYTLPGVMSQPFLMASPSCIPARQEQPSVDNPLRHCSPPLAEVRSQAAPLYYLHISLIENVQ